MYPSDGFNWHMYALLKNSLLESELVVMTLPDRQKLNTFKILSEALVRYDVQEETSLVVQVMCKSTRMAETFIKAFAAARLEHRIHTAIDSRGTNTDIQTSHGLHIRASDRLADIQTDVNIVIWPDFQSNKDESLAIPFRCSNKQAAFVLMCDRTYGFHRLIQLV